jgi:hypothetical protein
MSIQYHLDVVQANESHSDFTWRTGYTHAELESFYAKYKSDEPSSFSDIKYVRDKSSSEHPFEYLAYKMQNIYNNKLPIEELEKQLLDDST